MVGFVVPIERRRERPVMRSIMRLYRVNIAVRGEKEEREDLREMSYGLCRRRALGPLWLDIADFIGLR
jgi:hypothetical protein